MSIDSCNIMVRSSSLNLREIIYRTIVDGPDFCKTAPPFPHQRVFPVGVGHAAQKRKDVFGNNFEHRCRGSSAATSGIFS